MKGIRHYTADSGFHCIRVHYSADPEKDPSTERGALWFGKAPTGYRGGTKSAAWRQEMEIDWDATGGDLVFPQMGEFETKIIVRPFTVPESWDFYASFDYGHRNPSSFHVYAIDHDANVHAIWEYYRAGQGYRQIAKEIRACPYYDKLQYLPIADPSIWAKTQQVSGGDDNDMKSIAQLFAELPEDEKIIFAPGKKGGDITFAEKINGDMWNEDRLRKGEAPRFFIFLTCPMMIWEFMKLRYRDWSAVMQEQRNLQEEIIDRDNHSFDDAKMFFTMFFMAPDRERQPKKYDALKVIDPVSYQEWKNVDRMYQTPKRMVMGEFD